MHKRRLMLKLGLDIAIFSLSRTFIKLLCGDAPYFPLPFLANQTWAEFKVARPGDKAKHLNMLQQTRAE